MIIFENIETGETIGVSRKNGGKYYEAKLQALINSSNLGINHDRGQDFGWRLQADQQSQLEEWRENPEMISQISEFCRVPVDDLSDANILMFMLHKQEMGQSEKNEDRKKRLEAEDKYKARVKAAREKKAAKKAEPKATKE